MYNIIQICHILPYNTSGGCLINTKNTNDTIKTFDELVESDYCMMYFVRGCKEKRHSRGLCNKHYHMIRKCVLKGSLTWEKIEKQLKALPSKYESAKSFIKELSK